VRFEGTAPIYFAPITELPVPWLGALVEGFEDRGRIYAGALPDEVAAAMLAPSMLERLHRFRDPADRLPEMLARVGGMS